MNSQTDILKAVFDAGGSLTVAQALSQYGIYALSQRCGELRREGYPLESELVELPNGKHVSRYSRMKIAYG